MVFLPDNTHCVDADVQAKIEANGGATACTAPSVSRRIIMFHL